MSTDNFWEAVKTYRAVRDARLVEMCEERPKKELPDIEVKYNRQNNYVVTVTDGSFQQRYSGVDDFLFFLPEDLRIQRAIDRLLKKWVYWRVFNGHEEDDQG